MVQYRPTTTASPAILPSLLEQPIDLVRALERAQRRLHLYISTQLDRKRCHIEVVSALILYRMGNRMVRVADLKKDGIYFGSNPSYQISCLVEKGYVIGRDNDADRRSKFYLLTDQGLAVHAMVGKILVELEDEILEQTELGKDNLVLLREYLDRIGIMR